MKYYLNIFGVFICKNIGNMLDIIFFKYNIMHVFFKKTMIIFVTLKFSMILFNFVEKLTIIDITYNLLFLTSKQIIYLINLFFYIK